MMSEYTAHSAMTPAASRPTGPVMITPPSSLTAILARIEEAIEAETRAIRNDPDFDIGASNARKSRYLYELNRAIRSEGALGEGHADNLKRLRQKLAANEAAIAAHLTAVNELADLIRTVIHRAETDGTYSSFEFSRATG
jgi:hypothetical protein